MNLERLLASGHAAGLSPAGIIDLYRQEQKRLREEHAKARETAKEQAEKSKTADERAYMHLIREKEMIEEKLQLLALNSTEKSRQLQIEQATSERKGKLELESLEKKTQGELECEDLQMRLKLANNKDMHYDSKEGNPGAGVSSANSFCETETDSLGNVSLEPFCGLTTQ